MLLATLPLNCGARVKVTVETGSIVYVNIENVYAKNESRTICNCFRRFEVVLKNGVPSGTSIWLLGNGRGAARSTAE